MENCREIDERIVKQLNQALGDSVNSIPWQLHRKLVSMTAMKFYLCFGLHCLGTGTYV